MHPQGTRTVPRPTTGRQAVGALPATATSDAEPAAPKDSSAAPTKALKTKKRSLADVTGSPEELRQPQNPPAHVAKPLERSRPAAALLAHPTPPAKGIKQGPTTTTSKATHKGPPITNFFKPCPKQPPPKPHADPPTEPRRYAPPPLDGAPADGTASATMSVTTLNVQGLQTSKMNVRDITLGEYGPVPDIMVLTETKSKTTQVHQTWLKLLRKRYHIFNSCVPPKSTHARA